MKKSLNFVFHISRKLSKFCTVKFLRKEKKKKKKCKLRRRGVGFLPRYAPAVPMMSWGRGKRGFKSFLFFCVI